MTGTVVNMVAVLLGGTLGTLIGARLPPGVRQIVLQGVGLVTLVVGMEMALGTENVLVVLGSILIGGILGEWGRIDARLEQLGRWLEARTAAFPLLARGDFTRGFVTASLVFCVGPLTVLGAMQEGISGDSTLFLIKSVLDGFTSIAFAASLGMGVTFAALTVLVVQGGLTLGAGVLQGVLSDAMTTEIAATGGVMLLGIGLLLLEIKPIRVANFLPSLLVAPFLVLGWEALSALLPA